MPPAAFGKRLPEVYVEEKWAYLDPRCGIYFQRPDGRLASTWELWNNPQWTCDQPPEVKADVSPRWTWEERARICRERYFHPREVNGLQNYSLADAHRYGYAWLTHADLARNGMNRAARRYRRAIEKVLGTKFPEFKLHLSLSEGQTVRGRVLVAVKPAGFVVPPVDLTFWVDDECLPIQPYQEPFPSFDGCISWWWETAGVPDGRHVVRVRTAEAGDEIIEAGVVVNVANG